MAIREMNKGMAGMGGRGKNKPKNRQDQATARRRGTRATGLTALESRAQVPGQPATKSKARRNQKNNQRKWHDEKRQDARKSDRVPAKA